MIESNTPTTFTVKIQKLKEPLVFVEKEYCSRSNMCNITDHIISETASKKLKIVWERDYSVLFSGVNTFTEEFQDSLIVDEGRLHGADHVELLSLDIMKLQLGGHDHVGSQSQDFLEGRSDSNTGEHHHSSPVCDSLDLIQGKQASGKRVERELVVETSTKTTVYPGSSVSQRPNLYEIVTLLQNSETGRSSVTDVTSTGKNIINSPSALLGSGSQHTSVTEKDGISLDSCITSGNNHCIENHKQSTNQTVCTEKCLLIQNCWQNVGETRIVWESESTDNLKLENVVMLPENVQEDATHATAEGKDITQINEAALTPHNDMGSSGQKRESSTSSVPSNSFELNGGNFQKTEQNCERALILDSQIVLKSSLNEMALEKDEEKQDVYLEMGNNVTVSGAATVLVAGISELKSDHMEPYKQTLIASSDGTDSNNYPVRECEISKTAAEEVANSFQDTRNTGEFEQGALLMEPARIEVANSSSSEDESTFKIAEFFNNARAVSSAKQEYSPGSIPLGLPEKGQHSKESPHSLRALLSSEGTSACHKIEKSAPLNDVFRNDGEHLHRVAPSVESSCSGNASSQDESHHFPERWYEHAENDEYTSSMYSGPIPFSGPIAYSGPIPYSGSISHRSDSSTSTRSFAFPILASDWNSSPVKMAQPDSHFYKRRRRRCFFCFCCRRPSTFFD